MCSIQLLRAYAGENVDKSRIVLVSDGEDSSVDSILLELIDDGVKIDTVLYGWGENASALLLSKHLKKSANLYQVCKCLNQREKSTPTKKI